MGKKLKNVRKWNSTNELTLLELWQGRIGEIRRNRNNRHIHREISQIFKSSKVFVSTEQIRCKIKSLTGRYKQESSARGAASEWHLYTQVHAILGEDKFNQLEPNPADNSSRASPMTPVIEIHTPSPTPTLCECPSASPISSPRTSTSSPRAAKRQKKDIDELVSQLKAGDEILEKYLVEMQIIDREFLALDKRRTDLFEIYVTKAKQFQTDITNLLQK